MSDEVVNAVKEVPTPKAPEATAETFGLEYVQQLRGEAAKYRNEKKDAVEAAKTEVTQEWETKLTEATGKFTEVQGQLGSAQVEMTKLNTAIELGVPSDKVKQFASILQGTSEDQIRTSAESAKELFGGFSTTVPATDPTQGRGSGAIPLNGDPILQALIKAVGPK